MNIKKEALIFLALILLVIPLTEPFTGFDANYNLTGSFIYGGGEGNTTGYSGLIYITGQAVGNDTGSNESSMGPLYIDYSLPIVLNFTSVGFDNYSFGRAPLNLTCETNDPESGIDNNSHDFQYTIPLDKSFGWKNITNCTNFLCQWDTINYLNTSVDTTVRIRVKNKLGMFSLYKTHFLDSCVQVHGNVSYHDVNNWWCPLIIIDSVINNSPMRNLTVNGSVIIDSVLNKTDVSNSIIYNLTTSDSDVANTQMIKGAVLSVTDSKLFNSTFAENSTVVLNKSISQGNVFGKRSNINIIKSTIITVEFGDDSTGTYEGVYIDPTKLIGNNTIKNISIINSTIDDSKIYGKITGAINETKCFVEEDGEYCIYDTYIAGSTINESLINYSTVDNSLTYNSTVLYSTIKNSDILNMSVEYANIINNYVLSGEVIYSGHSYYGPINLTYIYLGIGTLNLNYTGTNMNVSKGQHFNVTVIVSCAGGECGDVEVGLDPIGEGISDCGGLQDMQNNLTKNYYLTQDIDCDVTPYNTGEGFEPIGNNTNPFNGIFDGQNYTINGLFINRSSMDYIGLFSYMGSGGKIKNVGLIDINVDGKENVGGLVALNYPGVDITNSYVTGSVSGSYAVGGLVGENDWGTINKCYAIINVYGPWGGGIVGYNRGNITNCYAKTNASGGNIRVGGLVGIHSDGIITNCYATGNVSVSDSSAGGLVGVNIFGIINNSYSTAIVSGESNTGGLVGKNRFGNITNCYWNNQTENPNYCWTNSSGNYSNDGCTAIQDNESYFYEINNSPIDEWDVVNTWRIIGGGRYPILKAVGELGKNLEMTYGRIKFPADKIVYLTADDIQMYIKMGYRLIYANTSALDPSFNSTANLTFYNVSVTNPTIFIDGNLCPNTICSNIQSNTTSKTVSFTTQHFTNFTAEKGLIPVNSGTPFYTTSANPKVKYDKSCLADMGDGDSCNVTWEVVVTGDKNNTWKFFALGNSTTFGGSAISNSVNITIIDTAPTTVELITPTNNTLTNNQTIDFDWTNATDIDNDNLTYQILVDDNSDFISPEINITIQDSNYTNSSLTDGTYYWKIRTHNGEYYSDWSEIWQFTIDTTAPSASIVINNGDDYTTTSDVWLSLMFYDKNGVKECGYNNFKSWNKSYDSSHSDFAYGVAVDGGDNVIVTGLSNNNYYTIKYDSDGNELWNKSYGGGYARGVAVDSNNNVIVTGRSHNGLNHDYYTIKYDSDGNELWNKSYDSGSWDRAHGVGVDSENNVIVIGESNNNYHTIKYDSDGNELWNKSCGGGYASGVDVDGGDNVIVTGVLSENYYTIKYNGSNGQKIWDKSYEGGSTDRAYAVAVDSNDNVIVTGHSRIGVNNNYYTIKYDSDGNELWNKSCGGGYASGVAVDGGDNVIVTGELSENYYTIKYDSDGNELWNKSYDGGSWDRAYGVGVDSGDNIIVTGYVHNGANYDYYTIKYIVYDWQPCTTIKSWQLSEEDGSKTVYYEVKDNAGNIKQVNDSIILGSETPVINKIECNNGTSWINCSGIGYNNNLYQIRANCIDPDDDIEIVSFKLENIPDDKTLLSGTHTERYGDYYIYTYDNIIVDSGEFNLTVTCQDSRNNTAVSSVNWTVPWGSLVVDSDLVNKNVTKNEQFIVNGNVTCVGGECGVIMLALDPSSENVTINNITYPCGVDDSVSPYDYGATSCLDDPNLCGFLQNCSALGGAICDADQGCKDGTFVDSLDGGTNSNASCCKDGTCTIPNVGTNYIGDDLSNATNLTLSSAKGIIEFGDQSVNATGVEFYVEIRYRGVYVNTSAVPGINTTANITLYNITIDNPIIFLDGSICPSTICSNVESNKELQTVSFTVEHFTTYNISKGLIPMFSGEPFYTLDQNPINCGEMKPGDTCSGAWRVVTTGEHNNTWRFFTLANSSYTEVGSNTSSFVNVTIITDEPVINKIECNNGTNWINCSDIGYADNLHQVRANVTDIADNINLVNFGLKNINDDKTLFMGSHNYNEGDWHYYTYDNKIVDSGEFNLTVTAYDSNDYTVTDNVNWTIDWGILNVSLINASDRNVTKNSEFTMGARVECVGGECGDVEVGLDPEEPPNCFDNSTDPIPICTCDDLQRMDEDLNANYALQNNVDCDVAPYNTGLGFDPVGDTSNSLKGTFDGQNYTITGLYINRSMNYVGLFGVLYYNANIKNIGLIDIKVSGVNHVGGLVGENHGTVNNSYSTGSVSGTYDFVGGLVGKNYEGIVSNSYSTVRVRGGRDHVGGLVGRSGYGTISNSYSTGSVNGSRNYVGGLVGQSGDIIINCYATGSVSGNNTVGGLVGLNGGTVSNSYWNNHTGNPPVCVGSISGGSVACTAIQDNETYFYSSSNAPMTGWDFTNIWIMIDENYPIFQWQEAPIPTTTNFLIEYGTTNFSAVADLSNVTNLTLATAYGKIKFPAEHSVNAAGEDYDAYVIIGKNSISINTSQLDPSFNSSAQLTFYNVTSLFEPVILLDGKLCPSDVCTNKYYNESAQTLIVDAAHFTEYHASKGLIKEQKDWNASDPFYTTDNNPVNKESNSCLEAMKAGDICTLDWNVAVTGDSNNTYDFFVYANSTQYPLAIGESEHVNVTIISTIPSVPVLINPEDGELTNNNFIDFAWEESIGENIIYNLLVDNDSNFGSPEINITTSFNWYSNDTLTNGTYYWEVRAFNNFGTSDWSDTWKVTLDQVAPNASILINNGANITNERTVALYLTYNDTYGVKECRYGDNSTPINISVWEPCSTTKAWHLSVGGGNKTVFYEVKDNAGNINQTNDTIFYSPPTIGGELNITYPHPNQTVAGNVTVNFTSFNNSPEISIDGADWRNTTTNTTFIWVTTQWADGAHTLQVRDVHPTTLATGTSYIILVYVDNLPAVGELIAEPSIVKDGDSIIFIYTGTETELNVTINQSELSKLDNNSAADLRLLDNDNDTIYEGVYNISLTNNRTDKDYTLTARVIDNLGNEFNPNVTVTLDNTQPTASISISNLGVVGFEQINPEFTAQRAVILNLTYNDTIAVDKCRYRNENLTWTEWESCSATKSWLLTEEDGLKTVYYQVRDLAGNNIIVNDTIYLNKTGVGLDITPPSAPVVAVDGRWTNNNELLHAYWYNASDRESELLHIPLEYEFKLINNNTNATVVINNATNWAYTGTSTEIIVSTGNATYSLNESLDHNTTYIFVVRAINSAGLRSENASSDGITVDTSPPTAPIIDSLHPHTWYNNNSPFFNWTKPIDLSGINAFSYVLDTIRNTIPDNVPEGNLTNLSAELSTQYTNLADGIYYFYVKAQDNALNWGATKDYKIMVDTSAPTVPQLYNPIQTTGTGNLTFNWTVSRDSGAPVYNYKLQISNVFDFNTTINDTWVGNKTGEIITGLTPGITYYARVKSKNKAGINSSWSNDVTTVIDTTAPIFLLVKPNGTVVSNKPILVVETDEDATCSYVDNNSIETTFAYTGTTWHESQVSGQNGGNYNYTIICKDQVGNEDNVSISFTIRMEETVINVDIPLNLTFYEGDIVTINLTTTPKLGEISKPHFNVYLDDELIQKEDITLIDRGSGNYQILFDAPDKGTYKLKVKVYEAESTADLEIKELSLTITYQGTGLISTSSSQTSYASSENYTIGIGSDSDSVATNATTTNLSVTAGKGTNYIFITDPDANVKSREKYLRDQNFLDLINPSFGYEIDDEYTINTELGYEDIVIIGDDEVSAGRHTIVIRNLGFNSTTNKTMLQVEII